MNPSKGIWYVGFPTYRYNEDVQALAAENGLRILNARFDAGDGAKDVPTLTVKGDKQKPSPLLDYFRKSKLEEKPTISELKEATGEKYSGSEITEAWHEYEAD